MKGGAHMTITIKYGHEFKPNREEINSSQFFYPVYEQALKQLEEIVKYGEVENVQPSQDYLNNIIAFCGERGQGKTTAMLSFSDALKNADSRNKNEFLKMISGLNRRFHVLDVIDPTQMEDSENIISIILSKIFLDYKKIWDNRDNKGKPSQTDVAGRNELLEQFRKCYTHVQTIKAKHKPSEIQSSYEDSLQELLRLGDSSRLKEDMREMLQAFFKFYAPSERCMLVLQIDDTDLNINKAYEIVEDLRKYFALPDIVVLMASKIEQLSDIVEQQICKDYKVLMHKRNQHEDPQHQSSLDEFRLIAARYIGKLIPENRRMYLPEPSAIPDRVDEKIIIKYMQIIDGLEVDILGDNHEELKFQERILRYIRKKIGIRFATPENGPHFIIPKTMRGLVDLLSILSRLEDFGEPLSDDTDPMHREKINKHRLHNLEKFEQYFLANWVPSNIENSHIEFLWDLANTPTIEKHLRIITHICNILANLKIFSLRNTEQDRHKVTTAISKQYKKSPLYYSVGDVMDTLVLLEDTFQNKTTELFCFAVRTLYTITMHKLYFRYEPIDRAKPKESFTLLDDFIGGDLFGKVNSSNFFPGYAGSQQDRGCFYVEEHRVLEGNLFNADDGWDNQKLYVYECLKGDENLIHKQDQILKETRFTAVHFWVSIRFVRRATFRYKWEHPHESYMLLLNMEYLWSLVNFQIDNPNREKGKADVSSFLKQFYRNAEKQLALFGPGHELMYKWLNDIAKFDHTFLDDLYSLTSDDSNEHRIFNTSAHARDFRSKNTLLGGMSRFYDDFNEFAQTRRAIFNRELYDRFINLKDRVESEDWSHSFTKEYRDIIQRLANSLAYDKEN